MLGLALDVIRVAVVDGGLAAVLGIAGDGRVVCPGRTVDGDESIEHPLHPGGQRIVGACHRSEQGVAAVRRDRDAVEDRSLAGLLEERVVAVPAGSEGRPLARRLPDLDYLRMLLHPDRDRVDVQISEASPERDLVLVGEALAAKREDRVVEKCAVDLLEDPVLEWLRQIDPVDLGSDVP